jgi:TrmH family RNA methyltransferase
LINKNSNKELVSGLSKNKIKWIRSLQQKKIRDELKLYVVEGEKMVSEAIQLCPEDIESVYFLDNTINVPSSIDSLSINEKELQQISGLKTPNKAIAILRQPKTEISHGSKGLTLVLDGVQDPGNLGTILRIADWFGIEEVICSTNTVECFNPKVVQATMGAIFRIKVLYCDLVNWLSENKKPIYGALLEGQNVYNTDIQQDAVLILGNEGQGITREIQKLINHPIMIPRFGKAESLNVSIATGILVSEFKRRSS